MRRFLLASALLAIGATALAQAPIEPEYREGSERIGQPSRIVAPEYPPLALMDKRGGVVEITGRVSPFGILEDAKVTVAPSTGEEFAVAVRDVLEYWLFHVPTDNQCQPDPHPIGVRVEFGAEDGKPHVGVVRLASPKVEPQAHYKAIHRVEPNFPKRALNEGIAGTVYARIDVDGEGRVSDVNAHAYSIRKAEGVMRSLENETRSALMGWRYPPPPEGKPWAGCYVINYRFRD